MTRLLIEKSELVIFDWDGTLIDSHNYIIDTMLIAAEATRQALPSREQVSHIIGMSMLPAIKTLFPHMNEQQIIHFRSIYTQNYNDVSRKQPALFAGVEEALSMLKSQGKTLAIATGKRQAGLLSGLEDTSTSHFFSTYRTADHCASKPHPEMVLSILDELAFYPEQAVVIGDNVLDITMARSADVKSIGVTTGSSSHEAMLEAGADACFESFSSIFIN